LVRKEHIDKDTGHYVNELADIFDYFKSKHFTGDVAGLFLLGDCFLNSLVNKKFRNYISEDKLFVLGNNDIPEILASYPKIDFKRYIDQESRIKALAEAEELKQIEQRALEDRLRKEQELLQNKEALEKQTELNKIEAQQKYERAVELELEGKLEDAKVNLEQAVLLDMTSKQISIHHANLLEKIRIRNEKNELYKSYLNKAEKYKEHNKLEKALEEYEAAKLVFDNAEIVKAIIEIKRLIKETEKQQEKIAHLLTEGNSLLAENKFDEAESKLNDLLVVDSTNKVAIKILAEIPLLKNKHQDEIQKQERLQQFNEYIQSAKSLFDSNKYQEAKGHYELAAAIQKDKKASEGIEACNAKLKEIEDTYSNLVLTAVEFEKKGYLAQSIDFLNQAIALKGKNDELKSKIKKLEFDLKFKISSDPSKLESKPIKVIPAKPKVVKPIIKSEEEDFFAFAKRKETLQKTPIKVKKKDDDFLKKKPKNGEEKSDDDFGFLKKTEKKEPLIIKGKKAAEKEEDFLGLPKKIKNQKKGFVLNSESNKNQNRLDF
jgi:tetratricopeptide (TPR) repeat protein